LIGDYSYHSGVGDGLKGFIQPSISVLVQEEVRVGIKLVTKPSGPRRFGWVAFFRHTKSIL
jgi:hypothetical protein